MNSNEPFPRAHPATPAYTSTCLSVSGSTLATVVSPAAKNGWTKQFLARNVSSKFRKGREISLTVHLLQTLSLLLAHGKAQTKSESVYLFLRNSIVPTSQQWRENNCYLVQWNVGQSPCKRFLFGEPLRVYQR